MQSDLAWVRRSGRLIRMVSELHRMGYQHARIMPYEYPLAYRIVIAPRSEFSLMNGAYFNEGPSRNFARYSSADENHYFGWKDAEADNARQLADKFVARFPELIRSMCGSDWRYAGWLADLLSHLERFPGRLPIVVAESLETLPEALPFLPLKLYGPRSSEDDGEDRHFPLPPPPV
ncbi:hypothetical protein [Inquilinus sp. Marseille-Q2685]|uniref:hypothetical protein n=1 Tax=Inquilinus sp. Marseille-Q2685 TaxID=2866581 RepID=UPI001CE46731|nr:hypothetical protein [Inquilinus sp. Marseille-Q2685]